MKRKLFLRFLSVTLLITFITACSVLNLTDLADEQTNEAEQPAEDSKEIIDEDEEAVDEDTDGLEDGEVLTCFHADNFVLNFDHTLTINAGEASLTHILKQGGIALANDKTSEAADSFLTTVLPQELTFEYMGVAGPCDVSAGGTVIVSAEGYCNDGIVYLTITEDWQDANGTMTCDDETQPFWAPGYTAVHSGATGNGEEFLIVNDLEGYTVMREFLAGDGYHSWTLMMDISLVPLVPEP